MPVYLLIIAMLAIVADIGSTDNQSASALPSQPYSVCVREASELPMYASESCMAGLYSGNNEGADSLEKKVNAESDVRIFKLGIRDDVPTKWLKDCTASGKLPMLIIDSIATEDRLKAVAERIGYINVPVLIELDYGSAVEAYNSHSRLIRAYANKAAVVWGVDIGCADFAQYYPEDSLVDYVAVNVKESCISGIIQPKREGIKRACDYFRHKGIILNVGVSHFSNSGYGYNIADACEELKAIYSLVRYEPNVYCVNYFSTSDFDTGTAVHRDSCRLTDSKELLRAYSEAVLSLKGTRCYRETAVVAYRIVDSFVIGRSQAAGSLFDTDKGAYSNLRILRVSLYDDKLKKVFVN
jgi:hypothetical protein